MGKVYLIGAGPGTAGLITVRGMDILRRADSVVYDSLIDPALLGQVRADCHLVDVGKRAGRHSEKQERIEAILIEESNTYNTVVRLKGGDSFVFGRGGEEVLALQEAGVDFELIPGVTSAVAVPELAGIPVTHRMVSRSFHVITGHTADDGADYRKYAMLGGTLVFLMGLGHLRKITGDLLAGGIDAGTPAAVISNGGTAQQKVLRATVATIAEAAVSEKMEAPAIIVVGETAAYEMRSRADAARKERVAIVGTDAMYQRMVEAFDAKGLNFETVHCLRIEPSVLESGRVALQTAMQHIEEYSWITFASRYAVQMFFDIADEIRFDRRRLAAVRLAAVGAATAKALRKYGYTADLIPSQYTTADLADTLEIEWSTHGRSWQTERDERPVLAIRAKDGSEDMFQTFDLHSIPYERVILYEAAGESLHHIDRGSEYDWLVLASASGVRSYMEKNEIPSGCRIACIGSFTAKQLAEYGAKADRMPVAHTAEALADCMI